MTLRTIGPPLHRRRLSWHYHHHHRALLPRLPLVLVLPLGHATLTVMDTAARPVPALVVLVLVALRTPAWRPVLPQPTPTPRLAPCSSSPMATLAFQATCCVPHPHRTTLTGLPCCALTGALLSYGAPGFTYGGGAPMPPLSSACSSGSSQPSQSWSPMSGGS